MVAAEITNSPSDRPSYQPMIKAARDNVRRAGSRRPIRQALADAGYWTRDNVQTAGIESFIAPGKARELGKIAEAEDEREQVLAKVEAGALSREQAGQQLRLGQSRIDQLLRNRRRGQPESLTSTMMATVRTPSWRATYKKRSGIIEPVFGQIKSNRGINSFLRRGITAADSEWKLICATHNLLKVYRMA